MKKPSLLLCCVCLLLNVSIAYGDVVKRDTLVEDFSSPDIAQYNTYATQAVWTAQNGITWHCENMRVGKVGKLLVSSGLTYYYNVQRTFGRLQTGKIRGLHKLSFETASTKGSSYSVKVSYSLNGKDWIEKPFPLQTSYMKRDSIVFPETGDYYIRFYIGGVDKLYLYLDNITFYTEQTETGERMDIVDWTANSLTLNMNGCAPETGVQVSIDGGAEKRIEEGSRYSYLGQKDRTYCVETENLYAGNDVQIETKYGDSEGNGYISNRTYKVPYIYGDSTVHKRTYNTDDDIVVRGGKTTLTTEVAVRNVYVYPDGELVVAEGGKLTCAKLFVRTNATEAGSVSGNIQAHESYYTRIVANKTKYFQFALPVQSFTSNVVTTAGDVCVLDKHWRLNTYDTQLRAEQGNITDNWVRYTGETIEADKGYAILSASPYYREYLFPVVYSSAGSDAKVAVTAPKGEVDVAHDGWNYICSPHSGKYASVLADDPTERVYVSELSKDGNRYWQHVADTIYPARPFYYQAAEAGNLVFGETLRFEATISETVAAHIQAANTVATQWLQIGLYDTAGQNDETHICLHPTKFHTTYEVGKDLLKLHGTGQHVELYSVMPCGELCFNALPDTTAEKETVLCTVVPQSGNYTLRINKNAYIDRLAKVVLTDRQENTQTDLTDQDYTFSSPQGESKGRFAIRCVFRTQETPTDMHEVKTAGVAQKILQDGQLYILSNGIKFDLLGRRR